MMIFEQPNYHQKDVIIDRSTVLKVMLFRNLHGTERKYDMYWFGLIVKVSCICTNSTDSVVY